MTWELVLTTGSRTYDVYDAFTGRFETTDEIFHKSPFDGTKIVEGKVSVDSENTWSITSSSNDLGIYDRLVLKIEGDLIDVNTIFHNHLVSLPFQLFDIATGVRLDTTKSLEEIFSPRIGFVTALYERSQVVDFRLGAETIAMYVTRLFRSSSEHFEFCEPVLKSIALFDGPELHLKTLYGDSDRRFIVLELWQNSETKIFLPNRYDKKTLVQVFDTASDVAHQLPVDSLFSINRLNTLSDLLLHFATTKSVKNVEDWQNI